MNWWFTILVQKAPACTIQTQAEAVRELFKHQSPSFKEGDEKRNILTEFNSDNTVRLDVEQTKEKIATLEYIQNELKGIGNLAK